MNFFLINVLMPQSNGLVVTLLSGNLPVRFATLGLLVEALAKCYYADERFGDVYFESKLAAVEAGPRRTTTGLIREVDAMVGTNDELSALWTGLSNEWIHVRGFAAGLAHHIGEAGFPNWGLIVPSVYQETRRNQDSSRRPVRHHARISRAWPSSCVHANSGSHVTTG
jgi:hypothetical protein